MKFYLSDLIQQSRVLFSSRARIIFVLLFLCNNVCAYSASLRDGSSVCSIADFTKNVQLLLQLIHRRQEILR